MSENPDRTSSAGMAGNGWTRPQAMRKDQNRNAWLVLFGLVCLGVATWGVLNGFYWKRRERVQRAALDMAKRESDSFVAIVYDGVTTKPEPGGDFVSTKMFESQLDALKAAGYTPITLDDVARFYKEKRLLPAKSLLITFENSRRSSYFTTAGLLEKRRWHAVMGVVTDDVRKEVEGVILAPYLERMKSSPTWELAVESDHGTGEVTAGADGRKAMFFSAPAWLPDLSRFETLEEFDRRIRADHAAAVSFFTNKLECAARAFFFPMGNYGQFEAHNRPLREANLKAVEDFYEMGFVIDGFGYNDAHSDPRRLARLKVDPTWSADELVRILDGVWPRETPGGWNDPPEAGDVEKERWRAIWGECIPGAGSSSVYLRAKAPDDPVVSDKGSTTGSKALVMGSNAFAEGSLEIKFRMEGGGFTVFLNYVGEDDTVMLTLGNDSSVILTRNQPERPGGERLAAEFLDSPISTGREHSLVLVSRNGALFTMLDGRMLFAGGVSLGNPRPKPGFVGAGVWSGHPGEAVVEIMSARLRAPLPRLAVWDAESIRDKTDVFAELERQAFRYDGIAPPWFSASDGMAGFQLVEDLDVIKIEAAKAFCGVWPRLKLSGKNPFGNIPRETSAEAFKDGGFAGLYIDASELDETGLPLMRSWIASFRQDTGYTNMPVAVRFPASFVSGSLAVGFLDTLPGVTVVAADGSAVTPVLWKRMHGLLPVVPNGKDGAVNYYQLAKIDANPQDAQPGDPDFVVRVERLLTERRFLEADAAAKRWTEAMPTSADAWEYKARLNVRETRGDDAAAAYRKALELDPGRISVVTAFADYLMTTGKAEDEAREMLDRYAKAFPLNREIALAQARWLDHKGMRADARAILKDWVKRQPDNIDNRVALHNYLNDAPERYENLLHIIDMVAPSSQNLMWFRRKIESSGLFTFPESSAAFDFLRRVASDSKNGLVRRNYMTLMPLEQPISENFSMSSLSDNWEVFGNTGVLIGGEYLLPGLPDPSETNLRLKRSDLIRDGFVEARIGESLGAFWLYARRSTQGMVRFGFDSDGFLRIQAWQNGEPRVLDSVLWVRPKDDLTLRLEVRGDGAIGYFNGRHVFSTSLEIPRVLGYGWWGVAASASETGMAQTRLKELSSGPLRPTIAVMDLLPTVMEAGTSEPAPTRDVLEALRARVGDVGVIAPVVGQQAVDRTFSSPDARALDGLRVFVRYHRLRLMPIVDLGYYNDPEPADVIAYMKKSGFDGLCLRVRRLPEAEWCAKMEKALEALFANVILIQSDKPLAEAAQNDAKVVLHELQRGSLYLQTGQATWETQAEKFEKWKASPAGKDRTGTKPMLVVMPRGREN